MICRPFRRIHVAFAASLLFLAAVSMAQTSPNASPTANAEFPMSTTSPKAHELVKRALSLYLDQVEQEKSTEILRQAVKLDPQFAMAHELLAQISLDSGEQVREQAKAYATRRHATLAEQHAIEWYQDAADHKLISAITKMNDVVNQYPHDKWAVWMTTWWLMTQSQYQRSIAIYERSEITDSPGLLNNMAYNYAAIRQFDKAFALMEKYIASMPGDPNPQDSYAEILRMAGSFDKSIEHYRAALAINPEFYSSQFGLADTYSLMGDQMRARREYEAGFKKFSLPEQHWTLWKSREAATYVREGDFSSANRAFQAIAGYAHAHRLSQTEADVYRQMAMYQPQPKQSLAYLNKAQIALKTGTNALPIALTQELAQILRLRVETAIKMDDTATAHALVARLADISQSSNDTVIDLAYHGAAGALLFSQQKYTDAISHLQEDVNNPLSLELLAQAYQQAGYSAEAKNTDDTLASVNDTTLEQALVVPAFRECYRDASCSSNLKPASLKHMHLL